MSSLALGTVQFDLNYGIANRQGQVSLSEAKAIIEHAFASGIETLDTAVTYGDSEKRLGEIGIRNWRVVPKLPGIPDGCRDIGTWAAASVHESLSRLGVGHLYDGRADETLVGTVRCRTAWGSARTHCCCCTRA